MTRVNSRINNWDLWSGLEYIISGKTLIVSIYLLPVYVQLHLYTYPRTLNPDPPLRSTDGRCIIKEVITYRMLLFRFMVTWMSLVFFSNHLPNFLEPNYSVTSVASWRCICDPRTGRAHKIQCTNESKRTTPTRRPGVISLPKRPRWEHLSGRQRERHLTLRYYTACENSTSSLGE